MKKLVLLLMVLFVCLVPAVSSAEVTYGSRVSGIYTSFTISGGGGTTGIVSAGAVEFDPTSQVGGIYNRVYILNNTANDSLRGLYSADIVAETYSGRLALAGTTGNNNLDSPGELAVDSSGNAYACYGGAPSVWKVANPSGTPVETQMLGNIGDAADDDPGFIGMIPTDFGGGYTSGSDLLMVENDLDAVGLNEALIGVRAGSTAGEPDYSILWQDEDSLIPGTIRAAVSDYDGYAYFSYWALQTANLDGDQRAFVYRMNGSKELERVFLDIDLADLATLNIDDAVAINPADGSLWLVMKTSGTLRTIYRLDAGDASLVSGTDYLASFTAEIIDFSGDILTGSTAFSPDGSMYAIAQTAADTLTVFNIVPEPATVVLLVSGGLMLIKRRRS